MKKKINSKILCHVQRRILLRVICGYRIISCNAVFALAGYPPLDINILQCIGYKESISYCSSSVSNHQLPLSALPHPSVRQPAHILDSTDVVE